MASGGRRTVGEGNDVMGEGNYLQLGKTLFALCREGARFRQRIPSCLSLPKKLVQTLPLTGQQSELTEKERRRDVPAWQCAKR